MKLSTQACTSKGSSRSKLGRGQGSVYADIGKVGKAQVAVPLLQKSSQSCTGLCLSTMAFVVGVTVVEDEVNVLEERVNPSILVRGHLLAYRLEVHGMRYDVIIVWMLEKGRDIQIMLPCTMDSCNNIYSTCIYMYLHVFTCIHVQRSTHNATRVPDLVSESTMLLSLHKAHSYVTCVYIT